MKAIAFRTFGGSSVLEVAELDAPVAKKDEVLVHITHTSVNPVDWKIREGFLKSLFPHIFPIIPGWDAAGTIAAVGEGVTTFKVGDEVYAYARLPEVHHGTYAECIALPASAVAKKPTSQSLANAAGVPTVALTAFQVVDEIAKVTPGERVLVTGGAGGVGTYAIQLVKKIGGHVTTTTSTPNLEYVKGFGADDAIDYTHGPLAASEKFDVIIDTVGGESLEQASALLKPGGRIVSIVETPKIGKFHFVYPSGEHLAKLAVLFDEGALKVPETIVRNIREAAAAQDENRTRRVRGKVVLEVKF